MKTNTPIVTIAADAHRCLTSARESLLLQWKQSV